MSILQTLSPQREVFRRPYVYHLRSVLMFFVPLFFAFLFISYLSLTVVSPWWNEH